MRYIFITFMFLWPLMVWALFTPDSLKTAFDQADNDSLKVVNGILLSRQIHEERHNEEEEYRYAKESIELALKLEDTLLYARAIDNLGLLHRYHQYYKNAVSLHVKAFELVAGKNVDPQFKMIFANNAGVAYRYAQKFDLAIAYYIKALKIAEKENDLEDIAISSNGIGNALSNIPGREEEALKYFKQALHAEIERGNSLGIAMNYLSISSYYMNKGRFDQAREYLDKLLEINKNRKDAYGLAITYEFYGRCYFKEGKEMRKASVYFKHALQQFKELGNVHKQADVLYSLGELQLKQGLISNAKSFYDSSLVLAQKTGNHGLIMNNSYKLAGIYEKIDQPYKSLSYIKQGQLYEDSIKLSEQGIKIAGLIRKYNIEKKENQIKLLEKDKDLQQTLLNNQKQKLDQRRILILLLTLGTLSAFAIMFLQYRNTRTKRKANALLQKEEREKMKAIYEKNLAQAEILVTRLQINPHFLFNCLNAIKYLIQSEQNHKAMKYLVVFSRYTRMVLETAQKQVVSLTEELKLTGYYLTLEENRFENDFTYEIIHPDEEVLDEVYIPPLLLQPFIENAIWHGLLPSKLDKKILKIKIFTEKDKTLIAIDDNGVGRKQRSHKTEKKTHKSMGMQITKDRIELYNKSYSSGITCKVIDKTNENGEPVGTRIVIEVNFHTKAGRKKEDHSYS